MEGSDLEKKAKDFPRPLRVSRSSPGLLSSPPGMDPVGTLGEKSRTISGDKSPKGPPVLVYMPASKLDTFPHVIPKKPITLKLPMRKQVQRGKVIYARSHSPVCCGAKI